VLNRTEAFLEKPENLSVTLGSNAVFSCKTHKLLREYSSWVKITEKVSYIKLKSFWNKCWMSLEIDIFSKEIKVLSEGTETYRINNVTEDDMVILSLVFYKHLTKA